MTHQEHLLLIRQKLPDPRLDSSFSNGQLELAKVEMLLDEIIVVAIRRSHNGVRSPVREGRVARVGQLKGDDDTLVPNTAAAGTGGRASWGRRVFVFVFERPGRTRLAQLAREEAPHLYQCLEERNVTVVLTDRRSRILSYIPVDMSLGDGDHTDLRKSHLTLHRKKKQSRSIDQMKMSSHLDGCGSPWGLDYLPLGVVSPEVPLYA